jgi:hypothetical protein
MLKVFLLFAVVNAQPQGPTTVIQPLDQTCRQEFNMIRGLNQANDTAHNGLVWYGSCEPREISHASR